MSQRKRIVILGGGFGGVYTAKHLEKALGRRDDFEIILINKENYFVFQPMLPEVISGSIGLLDPVSPIRRLLPKTTVHVREIEAVDLEKREVIVSPGFLPHSHRVPFDYLVIAMGNVTDFRGLRGLPEHAIPFKNLADALYLRNHVIRALEEAAIEQDDPVLRKQLLTFVVAGGGFSGVEVVAELNDFVREVAQNYRGINPSEIKVVLLHSQSRILPEVSESLALFAQKILTRRGVDLRLNARLEAATGEEAIIAGGERIPTRTLVSTVPSSPHPIIENMDLPKGKNGRLIANLFMEVEGAERIYALGDCAMVPDPGGEGFSPPTAQHALRQGKTVSDNIVASIRGGEKRAFGFKGLGKMGSLGRRSAVAEIMGVKVSGFLAWWLWRTIYLMKMPGWSRRLKVASSWTLDLFLPAELVELKLQRTAGITQEHFEPGEIIFRQGDLGDRIYMIIGGMAEVVREGDEEMVLAKVGAGEFFGEMALLEQCARTATVRCLEPMDTLSLPKREFEMLSSYLPQLRDSLTQVSEARKQSNEQKEKAVVKHKTPGLN